MNKVILSMIVLSMIALFSYSTLFADREGAKVSRSIRIKGIFVLTDEQDLLIRIQQLSNNNLDRREFLKKLGFMLDEESYILSSSVRHSWPNDIVIEISEASPMAIINENELVLEDCSMMTIERDQEPANLVTIDMPGEPFNKEHCSRIREILPILNSLSVTRAEMLSNGDYSLNLGDGRLIVGPEDIKTSAGKIRRIANLIKTRRMSAAHIDMRYVSGVAVAGRKL